MYMSRVFVHNPIDVISLCLSFIIREESKGTDGETPRRGIREGEGVQAIRS
jgi:hypothetical protein